MVTLRDAFTDARALLALEPEELGDVLLELIHRGLPPNAPKIDTNGIVSNAFGQYLPGQNLPGWPEALKPDVTQALWEAIFSLEHAGLIMLDQTSSNNTYWRILTRRGMRLSTRQQAAAYRVSILPEGLVHPEIFNQVSGDFLRGRYDVAVFAAFKTIEIAVRKAGRYPDDELGVPLMRKAFAKNVGPLADKSLEEGEQDAQAHLFAGAIGAAKNPTSHRDVEMGSSEAARLILFASYLLSIVDSRS